MNGNTPGATAPATNNAVPRADSYFPGIADRDIELIERYAGDLATLARALRKNDGKGAKAVFPKLLRLQRDAARIRLVAGRATRRGE
jgi:hypothetical protein